MNSELGNITTEVVTTESGKVLVKWSDDTWQCGVLTLEWDQKLGRIIIDSEYLAIDTVLKILQNTK